ncbi:MAG: STAS/SEC14 domain-containing protein [Anaerolineales bacterium]
MPVMQVKMQLPTEELLKAVAQLNSAELEQFVHQVMHLVAQRRAPVLSHSEAELLLKLNQSTPTPEMQQRHAVLVEKRQAEALTDEEYEELLALTEHFEGLNVQRLETLVALARLRDVSLPELMRDLGIQEGDVV